MLNQQQFNKAMVVLIKAFPEKEFDLDVLWSLLRDLNPESLERSIIKIISNEKEIYKSTNMVALIRENAIEFKEKDISEAWHEVIQQINRVGSWGKPVFSSELIEKAVFCIGWKDICMSSNIAIERAHFFRVYESYLTREKGTYKVFGVENKKSINNSIFKIMNGAAV